MYGRRRILFKAISIYLIYAFLSAVLFFFIQSPKKQEKPGYIESEKVIENNDRVALIESGEDGINVRLNLIENAQSTIDISYYTLTEGVSVDLVFGSLIEAADRGVKVRVLLDGIFHNLSGELRNVKYALADHPNIEYKLYEPFQILKPRTWNNRLHDKLIIVDKKLALIGGRNIGDKYFDDKSEVFQHSKDRDILVYSPKYESASSVNKINNYFNEVFNHKYSKVAVSNVSKRQKAKGKVSSDKLKEAYKGYKDAYPDKRAPIDWLDKTMSVDAVEFVYNPIGRGNQDPWVLRKLMSLASDAKESVLIQSPYVILSRKIERDFEDFDFDYSKTKILTNSMAASPNPIGYAGYKNSRKKLIESGLTIYEYQGPMSIHGKTYIYDNKISAIGTFNFDARSSYLNSEIMVIVHSEDFANHLKYKVDKDLDNSLELASDLTYKDNDLVEEGQVSIFKKILIAIVSKIVYFVDYLL